MKKLFTLALLLCCTVGLMAQGTISGTLVDQENNEPLIGASIYLKGSSMGTISDLDGNFSINNVPNGTYTMTVKYLGYSDYSTDVNVAGSAIDLGSLKLNTSSVGLKAVEVIASLAIDRKTPVAVSTLRGEEIETLVGNQEFPEVLRGTPSVYVTKGSGGFGDSRINVRGFDQRNTAVMINGIPVNDMENGWVYWSNWAGLSDVTSSMQVQRGLGASKLAVASVGGSINIVTNAADFKKGGSVSIGTGNDGFQKYAVVLSSGLNDKGLAATMQLTHTRGDGYVDGTKFRAYSYFGSVSKTFNPEHTLAFTVVGAPQWHHQRSISNFDNVTLATFGEDQKGIKYNPVWGELDGEEFSFRKNFYHKPKAFINHYWNINDKTDLKTSAYVSVGRGGGTGPRGRLRSPGSIFDSYSGDGQGIHNADGQVRFDDIVSYNQGMQVDGFGDEAKGQENGQNIVSADGRIYYEDGTRSDNGSGFIRRASMNSHNWYGVLSTLTTELSENLDLTAGVDARYYKGEHYRRVENLLGADGYLSRSDINGENIISSTVPADFGSFTDDSHSTGENVLNYHNDGLVSWLGAFAQAEYTLDDLTIFAAATGSNQGFKRIDYFNYLNSDSEQVSDWQNFLGGTIKAGANYNINDNMNVFVNGGYLSRQPIFDNVFINFRNDVNPDASNQGVVAFEAGYGYRAGNFRGNINLYTTTWGNRQFDASFNGYDTDSTEIEVLANFSNVGETHNGIEIDFSYKPIRQVEIFGMASFGDWKYTEDFKTTLVNLDSDLPILGDNEKTLYANGLKVGDAAQTTMNLGVEAEVIKGLKIRGSVYFADNLYANFNLLEDQFFSPGGEVVKLPAYSLIDAGVSYNFNVNGIDITARLNANNLADARYVAEMGTNVQDDPDTADVNEFYTQNQGFYGFGRTWSAGLKVKF